MTPEQLETLLVKHFPKDATCWSQATDEVRDMCRTARIVANVPEELAVDFRVLFTPSAWNTKGIDGIVRFYRDMSQEQRDECIKLFTNLFPDIFR